MSAFFLRDPLALSPLPKMEEKGIGESRNKGDYEKPPESYDKESRTTVAAFRPWRGLSAFNP